MKPIKIDLNGPSGDTMKTISAALAAVNGKATSFVISDPQRVVDMAVLAESYLDLREVRASERAGAVVTYQPAGPAHRAYKYNPTSTQIVLRRKSGAKPVWYLDEVKPIIVYPAAPYKFNVVATPEAAVAAAVRLLNSLGYAEMPELSDQKIAA